MKQNPIYGLKIAVAQMPVIAGNPRANADWMIGEIETAEARAIDMLIFPELCISGYIIGDKFEDDSYVRDVWHHGDRVVAATAGKNITIIFGTIVTNDEKATGGDGRMRKINGGLVAQNGELVKNEAGLPFFAKTNLPKYRMFDEVRHMMTLPELAREKGVAPEELLKPFVLTIGGRTVRIGVITCEDGWVDDYSIKPPLVLAEAGIDLLVNVSASPWGWQKNRARHRAFKKYLSEIGVPMVYVNVSKPQNNGKGMYGFDGASTLYNKEGKVVTTLPPYYTGVQDITLSEVMPELLFAEPDDITQLFDGVVAGIRALLETLPQTLRPCVIGMSGGLDSNVVTALMVYVLGSDQVLGINMPYGNYNSDATKGSAAFSAKAHGIEYLIDPIDELVNIMARKTGVKPGTAEFKTIMAVQRMATLSGHARARGGFFTSNGNKTEVAFGYFTNDGDGRGAFAPIADLLKGEVAQLAYYLNTVVFGREVIPWELITGELPPMDELGPAETAVRKDPFDFGRVLRDGTFIRGHHDQMVHAFLGFRKDPEWFLEKYLEGTLEAELLLTEGKINELFQTPAEFVADLERCWDLFHYSTWKRVQSVTNIPVSKRPFGHDYRESILPVYYTNRYYTLRIELLTEYPLPNYWPMERRQRFVTSSAAGLTIVSRKGGSHQEIA